MQIGIWLPVYGGWLRTTDHAAGPDIPACLAIAHMAEAIGFDFLYASENLLNCIHGPVTSVADAWSLLGAIAAKTSSIGLIGAVKPGFRSPFLVARMIDTLSQIAGRRLGINIVCGWWRQEFELSAVPWLDHEGRYERADQFIRSFFSLFNPPAVPIEAEENTTADAIAPRRAGYGLRPDALPVVWVSGHSNDALKLTAEWGDCLFLNGMEAGKLVPHVLAARQAATQWGREISVAINAYVIAAESREQALSRYRAVVEKRNSKVISYFREIMSEAGAAAWAGLSDEEMIDSNAGFGAGLIGSFEDIAKRIDALSKMGVDTIVCQFDDPMRDAGPFMNNVIRPFREHKFANPNMHAQANAAPACETPGRFTSSTQRRSAS